MPRTLNYQIHQRLDENFQTTPLKYSNTSGFILDCFVHLAIDDQRISKSPVYKGILNADKKVACTTHLWPNMIKELDYMYLTKENCMTEDDFLIKNENRVLDKELNS